MDPAARDAPPSYDEVVNASSSNLEIPAVHNSGKTSNTTNKCQRHNHTAFPNSYHCCNVDHFSSQILPASQYNSLAHLDFFQSQPQIHKLDEKKTVDSSLTEKLLLEKELNKEYAERLGGSSEQDGGYAYVIAIMSFLAHMLQVTIADCYSKYHACNN